MYIRNWFLYYNKMHSLIIIILSLFSRTPRTCLSALRPWMTRSTGLDAVLILFSRHTEYVLFMLPPQAHFPMLCNMTGTAQFPPVRRPATLWLPWVSVSTDHIHRKLLLLQLRTCIHHSSRVLIYLSLRNTVLRFFLLYLATKRTREWHLRTMSYSVGPDASGGNSQNVLAMYSSRPCGCPPHDIVSLR